MRTYVKPEVTEIKTLEILKGWEKIIKGSLERKREE